MSHLAGDPISSMLEAAVTLHRDGSLAQAEALYRQVLATAPGRAHAYHLLGVLCQQTARADEALAHARKAIDIEPNNAGYLLSLGVQLKARRDLDKAISCFQRTLELLPNLVEAQLHLGDVWALRGDWDQAREHFNQAATRRPDSAEAHHRLGIASARLGDTDGAIDCYRRALEVNPNFPEAWNDLGIRFAAKGDYVAAAEAYRHAVAIRPSFTGAHNNLGNALRDAARPVEAVGALRRALELSPNDPAIHLNLANALRDAGDLDASEQAARQALAARAGWEEANYALGHTLVLKGDFAQGWPACEARWQSRVNRPEYPNEKLWNGQDISGLRILLHADHGFGDTIQFVRYAPMVGRLGAKVWVRCQRELRRLISTVDGIEGVVGNDELPPGFDLHCPLIALPRIFSTTLDSIPATVPYLKAEAAAAARWKGRLATEPASVKVGLAWAGSPTFREDGFRSPHLAAMGPLANATGVRFYSLQKGEAAGELRFTPRGMSIVDWSSDLNDFAATAALIEALDLVISSDTAVVHVAGALGKPVWVPLHYAPGFFWMLHRNDSPWYPTMRLFRQTVPAVWQDVMEKMAKELGALS